MNSTKFLWLFLVLAIFLGIIWQFYPLETAENRMDQLPLQGRNFSGQDVDLTPFEQTFFKGVNIIKRIYKINNRYYFVTVLDGTHNRHIVHDPFYCFKGSGWTIDSERNFPLKNGFGSLIQISKANEKKEALFWFSDGKNQYHSPLKYWWTSTLRRLTLGSSGPEPVLIMIQPSDERPVDWKQITTILKPLSLL
jgi:Protein of unknown function (DUF3485)